MTSIEKRVDSSGVIKTSNVVGKCSKSDYYKFLKENGFEKIAPGVYASSEAWIDSYVIIHNRCPQAIISHDAALYYYGLVDREPTMPTMTIYSGYNASRLKKSGYKVYFVKKEYLDIGKTEVLDFDGNIIPMYDLERTICDLVRNRNNFEIQDFNTAMKSYARMKEKNITKLFEYAKLFRIEKTLKTYMEVLL